MSEIEQMERDLRDAIEGAGDIRALEEVRVAALGKKGSVSGLMKQLGGMTPEERKARGPLYNQLKDRIANAIQVRKQALEEAELDTRLAAETVDVTLPVRPQAQGSIHPVSQVMDEITEIFADMGFVVAEGPDLESDWYNFTALNMGPEHPARQMHDTFYMTPDADGNRKVLRTHTSPVQIRTMMAGKPPFKVIAPGRTYRSDSDATHTPMFHQVEALMVDRDTHMGHLKGCIESFCKAFFEVDEVRMRFRPSYFPFTEPSAEVDIACTFKGDEIILGEGHDWMEILGCGMVNPRVLENANVDSTVYQGFALGMGIDRLAMLKYGIPDLRQFFESDLRWLRHYGFAALDIPTLATRGVR